MDSFRLHGLDDLRAGTLYCIGRNYAEHARELANEVPERPLVFLKPRSSLVRDGQRIVIPSASSEVHHEVELVAAIGRRCRRIPGNEALEAVAGYAVGIDVTARDIQREAKRRGHPWTEAKGFDTFAPVGNFVPGGRFPDPQQLRLRLRVNGDIRQDASTSLMLFPVAELIARLSERFTLHPGDLIFTGTPEGVSPLSSGDRVRASLEEGASTLEVRVEDDRESPGETGRSAS